MHVNSQINKTLEAFELSGAAKNERKVFACRILPPLQTFRHKIDNLRNQLEDPQSTNGWQVPVKMFTDLENSCQELSALFGEFSLAAVKPKWADFTDAGPGVGVTNNEVKFRDAEIARIFNSDY